MPVSLSLTLIAVFTAVALLVGTGLTWVLANTTSERRRLREVTQKPAVSRALPEIVQLSTATRRGFLEKIGLFLRSPKDFERLRARTLRAGYKSPSAPAVYTLVEYVGPIVVGAAVFWAAPASWRLFAVPASALLLFFAPSTILDRILAKRRREIENGLPDALDLLVVCIEAGSGIDQAIVRTAEELSLAYPALGDELRVLTMEIRAGKPRLEAFRNLAQRTKSDDVRALVAMLVQTERFGTSVGQALRTHADVSRSKRRQRAEERAQKIGVKLVFPLVFFFFPAFYVVVLGPAFIQFARSFGSR